MGSYLSSYLGAPQPAPPPRPARNQPAPAQRPVLRVPGERPLYQIPLKWESVNLRRGLVTEARRHFPNKLTPQTLWWPDPSCAKDFYWKRWLWNARNRGRFRSPVTVKIAPPGSRGSGFNFCSTPEPCARETVEKALSQCHKGKMKFDEPLWFESPEKKRRKSSPEARRSAFKPVVRNGVTPTFVPRPGLLKRRLRFGRETVWQDKAVPRPNVQPFLPAAQPATGAAPPWGTGPPLERRVKMQHSWDLRPSHSAWEQPHPACWLPWLLRARAPHPPTETPDHSSFQPPDPFSSLYWDTDTTRSPPSHPHHRLAQPPGPMLTLPLPPSSVFC